MGTYGLPADSFAQQSVEQWETEPAAPVPSDGSSLELRAPSLPVPHDQIVAWQAPVVTVLPIRAI
jgi:hypothetical protein